MKKVVAWLLLAALGPGIGVGVGLLHAGVDYERPGVTAASLSGSSNVFTADQTFNNVTILNGDVKMGQPFYVMVAWRSSTGYKMKVLTSGEGTQWNLDADDIYNPTANDFREPDVMWSSGTWYVARSTALAGVETGFALDRSTRGLANIDELCQFDTSGVPGGDSGTTYVFSPSWVRNEENELWRDSDGFPYLTVSISTDGGTNHAGYYMRVTDLDTCTADVPTKFTTSGFPIDWFDQDVHALNSGDWVMAYKDNDDSKVDIASGTAIDGTWTYVGTPNVGSGFEAPKLVKVDTETWRMYLDKYVAGGYRYMESTAPTVLAAWPTTLQTVQLPVALEHASIIRTNSLNAAHDIFGLDRSYQSLFGRSQSTATWFGDIYLGANSIHGDVHRVVVEGRFNGSALTELLLINGGNTAGTGINIGFSPDVTTSGAILSLLQVLRRSQATGETSVAWWTWDGSALAERGGFYGLDGGFAVKGSSFTVGSSTFAVTGGKVGIGTASPTDAALNVVGNSSTTGVGYYGDSIQTPTGVRAGGSGAPTQLITAETANTPSAAWGAFIKTGIATWTMASGGDTNDPDLVWSNDGSGNFIVNGATVTPTGDVYYQSYTTTELDAKTPLQVGGPVYNSTLGLVCVSTGTGAGAYVRTTDGTTACR